MKFGNDAACTETKFAHRCLMPIFALQVMTTSPRGSSEKACRYRLMTQRKCQTSGMPGSMKAVARTAGKLATNHFRRLRHACFAAHTAHLTDMDVTSVTENQSTVAKTQVKTLCPLHFKAVPKPRLQERAMDERAMDKTRHTEMETAVDMCRTCGKREQASPPSPRTKPPLQVLERPRQKAELHIPRHLPACQPHQTVSLGQIGRTAHNQRHPQSLWMYFRSTFFTMSFRSRLTATQVRIRVRKQLRVRVTTPSQKWHMQ